MTVRGEKRRVVIFNLDRDEDLALFEFSREINFARFVKVALFREMQKSKLKTTAAQASVLVTPSNFPNSTM